MNWYTNLLRESDAKNQLVDDLAGFATVVACIVFVLALMVFA